MAKKSKASAKAKPNLFTSDDLPSQNDEVEAQAEAAALADAQAEAEIAKADPFQMALDPKGLDEPSSSAPFVASTVDANGIADRHSHENKLRRTRRILAEEAQVMIRVPKAAGPQTVTINGARFNIPSNISVQVPQSVADLLVAAEII